MRQMSTPRDPDGYIGIDVGTQGLKAVVVDDHGQVVFTTFHAYATHSPQAGWREQDPRDWEKALTQTLHNISTAGLPVRYRGIGVSGQMHTTVVTNESGDPLYPAMLWSDQRTANYARQLETRYGLQALLELTGNKPLSNFSLLRVLWLQEQRHDVYQNISHVAVAKDWIRFQLTGRWATDVTDASGTYLLNVKKRHWAGELLSSLDIPEKWWGAVFESAEIVGTMHYGPPEFHGLPVVAGSGDQAASAVGTGIALGDLGISLGTSGVLFWPLERYQLPSHPSVHVFCHAEEKTWHWMSVTQSAALSLAWLRDQMFPLKSYRDLDQIAESAPQGSEGLLFLPYLNGERAPIMNPAAEGGFFGLSYRHHQSHVIRAVLEGVAYSLRHCYMTMNPGGLMNPIRMILTGGGAKSRLWAQILADVMGHDIIAADDPGAAVGAAWLVRSAITGTHDKMAVKQTSIYHPEHCKVYDQGFLDYQRLVNSLTPLWDGKPH